MFLLDYNFLSVALLISYLFQSTASPTLLAPRLFQMLRQGRFHCLLLLLLALLPVFPALPVSSPEIANKAGNSPNNILAQQQQQQQLKANGAGGVGGQEAHLNSLNAYAGNYDTLATAQAQPQLANEAGFKPSYKLPEMETNFTPMQGASLAADAASSLTNLPSTPMLMQYLPAQTLQDGSGGTVQYLQLIPTRPIIVPISPYLTAAAAAATSNIQAPAPSLSPAANSGAPSGTVQLGTLPANSAGLAGLHYAAAGLQGYANAISPLAAYRTGYRINRETKDKPFPGTFSLNLNEYLPGHDAAATGTVAHPHTQMYIRARP